MNQRLERLLKKQEELKAQIQQLKAKENSVKRKEDTRRKILLGALMEEMIEAGELDKDVFTKRLDGFLTREGDRKLFNLPEKKTKSEPTMSLDRVASPPSFEVILSSLGTDRISLLKVIRNLTNLELKEAKDLVESAPTLLMKVNDLEVAQGIKRQLEGVGATVTVRKSLN